MSQLQLRDYQKEGRDFLVKKKRAFLTDVPGAGKTLQAASALELPALIIAPKHLINQWADFLKEQYPDLKIACAVGTRKERTAILKREADIYIINMDMVATYDLPVFINTYVFDESHHLRNHTTDRARAAVLLANRNPKARVYMLTATPMWKSVADIFMQLRVLFPTVFKSYNNFVKTWCNSIDTPYGTKVIGIKKSMRDPLRELLAPIMLGRTSEDIGRQLPPLIESVIELDMPDDQRNIYNKIKKDYRLRYEDEKGKQQLLFNPIAALHTFRQITMRSGKIDAVTQIVDDNKLQSLIGCWYRDHAKLIYDSLPKDSAVLLTGDIEATERVKQAYKAQKEGKHIVCTQGSLVEGVNLYNFRQVIQVEEHYVPGHNEQFIKRVLRDRNDDGQDLTPVLKYCVHVKKSVDIDIHRTDASRAGAIEEMMEHVLA